MDTSRHLSKPARILIKSDPLEHSTSEVLIALPYYQRGTLVRELTRRGGSRGRCTLVRRKSSDCLPEFVTQSFPSTRHNPIPYRDLKPANVLIDERYTPVIKDLGVVTKARIQVTISTDARRHEEQAAERTFDAFDRAPELFNIPSQIDIEERSDVWASKQN